MGTGTPENPIRVLLIDDDEEDHILTQGYLKAIPGRHFHLDWVADYDKALDLICGGTYDVYLLDYHLGARNGLSLLKEALQKGCAQPIILLTGQGQFDTDMAAMQAGAADYLEKGRLDAVRLERTIRYAVLQKQLETDLESKVRERTRELEQEIDARRHVEDQLRDADRRKDEFLAMLGHELRNPLMPIQNAVSILRLLGISQPAALMALDILDRQSNVMVRLVNDLLDISRITTGKLRLEIDTVGIGEILESALEVSQTLLDRAKITCTVMVPPDLPAIQADRVRLAQVFTNLLNNAAKYTPAGGTVTVTACREEASPGQFCLAIRVRDTGIGMTPQLCAEVFDLFVQDAVVGDRASEGLGVGLALSRGVIELHGGTILARSDGPDQGTVMVVRLPLPGKSG